MKCPGCKGVVVLVADTDEGGSYHCTRCKTSYTGRALIMRPAAQRANPEPAVGRIFVHCEICKTTGFGCSNGLCDEHCMTHHTFLNCHFQEERLDARA